VCHPEDHGNPAFSLDDPYDSPGSPGTPGTNTTTGETWFPVDPGKSNKATVRDCMDDWIDTGTIILVPIYDISSGGGNTAWYHITGVAAFVVTSQGQPAVDNIQGQFVKYYSLSDLPSNGQLPPSPADTTVVLQLVQ